jgi:KaiC/GvpD/RAD55 family RecA-like ATPase
MKSRTVDISHKHYDGFGFIFGGTGLHLSEGTSVLIEGQAGVGKTVFALQMACRYLQKLCEENSAEYVLYYSFEQDATVLQSLIESFKGFATQVSICLCNPEDSQHTFVPQKLHIISRPPSDELSHFIDNMTLRITKNPGCALVLLDSIGYFDRREGDPRRDQLDRLCQRAREGEYAIIIVREKEPSAAAAVAEYITDNVFELQLKPINPALSYGPQVRTIEIKKSRAQKSLRGPHEFEIKEDIGILIFPSPDSVFPRSGEKGGELSPLLEVFQGDGEELLRKQLQRSERDQPNADSSDTQNTIQSGLRAGECLLLYGDPGSLKTAFGFNFLRIAIQSPNEACIFVTFKIDERALEGISTTYLDKDEYEEWQRRNRFIDARQTFWTPARVLSEIRTAVLGWTKGEDKERPLQRAVVFGLGMIDKLPAFQGQELTFLQVLISYFESEGISAIFIDWPQEARQSQLYFESIVNYFSTTIERVKPQPQDRDSGDLFVRVTRHQFRVANNETLRISEKHIKGRRALKIEKLNR